MRSHGPVRLEDEPAVVLVEIPIDVGILKSNKDKLTLPEIEANGAALFLQIAVPGKLGIIDSRAHQPSCVEPALNG